MATAKKAPAKSPAKKAAAPAKSGTSKKTASTKPGGARKAATPAKKAAPGKKAAPAPAKKAVAKKAAPSAKKAAPSAKKGAPSAKKGAPAKKSAPTPTREAVAAPAKTAAPSPAKKVTAAKQAAPAPAAAKKAAPAKKSSSVLVVIEIPPVKGVTKEGVAYTKDFDVKFLTTMRALLLEEKAALTGQATRLENEANSLIEEQEMGDVQFDDEGGEGDTMVVERERDLTLSAQARQTIADIDTALQRLTTGHYGYSTESGRPIPRERLEAIPWATMLVEEKVGGIGRR